MIQKTFRGIKAEECLPGLERLSIDPAYRRAKSRLVQVYAAEWDEKKLQKLMSLICLKLRDATVIGMTGFMESKDFAELTQGFIITVLLFADSQVTTFLEPDAEGEEGRAGVRLNHALKEIPEVRAVQVFSCGETLNPDGFLKEAAKGLPEMPFFGAMAAILQKPGERPLCYLMVGEKLYPEGTILTVVYSGAALHVRTSYNLGWVPIGKKMTITKMEGDYIASEIDGVPATEVYRKYLGLSPDQINVTNTCEFPILLERGEWQVGRAVNGADSVGRFFLTAPVYQGDTLRFSYANTNEIFRETYGDSREIEYFKAQALLTVSCGNRTVFLKEQEEKEIGFYREVAKEMIVIRGNAEILYENGNGGILNSALVTLAFREGDAEQPDRVAWEKCRGKNCPENQQTIPLVQRLLKFLEATTHELTEMAEAAKAASEAKSSFISNMSHEIRTPINAVLGLDEMILRETKEEETKRYASDIRVAGRTLLSLINDILDASRIESGKLQIVPVEYEISSLLNDLVNMITVRAQEKNLEFVVDVDPTMPHLLCGDDTRIKQCALNVLTNAVKYTREGKVCLFVSYEKTGEQEILLKIRVTDTGIGIKEEDMNRLFSRFERIDEEKNRTIEGTGLGMSIVRQLLALMNTELQVHSVYGQGSDFSFAVRQRVVKWEPIGNFTEMYERSLENAQQYEESFRAPEGMVLVVDDTRMNLTVFTSLLKGTGLMVDTADSGFQALEQVKKKHYDVIFLDQRMPEMDGIETLQRMKALPDGLNEHTPVIMLTANAVSGAREQFLAAGFDDYLSKPINGAHLEQMLMDYLPKEKVMKKGSDDYDAAGGKPEEKAPSGDALSERDRTRLQAFRQIPEIDYRAALANCMREDILLEAVHAFFTDAKTGPEEIERYLSEEDGKNYTVKVHALKSSARIIGAGKLSEEAAYLEECGNRLAWEEIREKTPKLLTAYRNLAASLAQTEAPLVQSEADTRPSLPMDQVLSAYRGIGEMAEAFDFDGAGDILQMLSEYRLPEGEEKRFEEICDQVTRLDREALLPLKGILPAHTD